MICNYRPGDREAAEALWADNASRQGYAPRNRTALGAMLFDHPYFSPEHTFVLEEGGILHAFICGCTGDDIPGGKERGYFTCLIADEAYDTEETTEALFRALEDSFRAKGKTCSAVTFFNPMHLPWVIPCSPGFEHNNMPGINVSLPLHERMLRLGYVEPARECAMFRDLSDFVVPETMEARAVKLAQQGYTVDRYDAERHIGLQEMLTALKNPDWIQQITQAAEKKMLLPVALAGNRVAGFAGPVYPEATGRGYFAGIGIMPQYQHHGLGSLLFYRLCEEEKRAGAKYMSLFTGENNPAKRIYEGAGFQAVRKFGVMIKQL
jgi:ribosomal protein S18 acetylase RimI-like enzyme